MHDVQITTFGYLHGAPPAAHLTLDLREHFRDPHHNPGLRTLTADHEVIRSVVLTTPGIQALADATTAAVLAYLAGPAAGPVTLAVGCAGGRHRAPTVGAHIARALRALWGVPVTLTHRDMAKPVIDRASCASRAGRTGDAAPALDALAEEWTTLAADHERISAVWATSARPDREHLAGVARGRARQLTDCAAALRRALDHGDVADVDQRAHTHPDVLTIGVRDGWADPETDPADVDWGQRLADALLPYEVIDGRPVNPHARTAVRRGRNQLGRWGEQAAADALVTATDTTGRRHVLLVERGDGGGWAIPGGMVEPGETPAAAAVRELAEETGLRLPDATWQVHPPRYVPDPRASDEAWIVTVVCTTDLGPVDELPAVAGADDADRAAWIPADTYQTLTRHLADAHGGTVWAAHADMLRRHA
jgi:8-oxo-dGTP pyrophosphatase MutT (NUDIX family)